MLSQQVRSYPSPTLPSAHPRSPPQKGFPGAHATYRGSGKKSTSAFPGYDLERRQGPSSRPLALYPQPTGAAVAMARTFPEGGTCSISRGAPGQQWPRKREIRGLSLDFALR